MFRFPLVQVLLHDYSYLVNANANRASFFEALGSVKSDGLIIMV